MLLIVASLTSTRWEALATAQCRGCTMDRFPVGQELFIRREARRPLTSHERCANGGVGGACRSLSLAREARRRATRSSRSILCRVCRSGDRVRERSLVASKICSLEIADTARNAMILLRAFAYNKCLTGVSWTFSRTFSMRHSRGPLKALVLGILSEASAGLPARPIAPLLGRIVRIYIFCNSSVILKGMTCSTY